MFCRGVICGLLVLVQARVAVANPYFPAAQTAANEAKTRADEFALLLVQQDLGIALQRVQVGLVRAKELQQSAESYASESIELERKFRELSLENVDQVSATQQQINAFVTEYEKLFSQLIDHSFKPSEIRSELEQTAPRLKNLLEYFEYQCQVGRADREFNADLPLALPPPEYKAFYNFMFSTNPMENAASYESLNYDNKTLNDLGKVATGVSGLGFSIGVAATGKIAAAAMTTGGVALIVVGVIALVSFISGSEKAKKRMTEFVDAEVFKFNNIPRADYVASVYKQSCTQTAKVLKELLVVIERATSPQSEVRAQLKDELLASESRISSLRVKSQEFAQVSCFTDLLSSYSAHQCVAEQSNCAVGGDRIVRKDGACQISVVEAQSEVFGAALKEKHLLFANDAGFESELQELVKADLGNFLVNDVDAVIDQLESTSWVQLLKSQTMAFRKISRILGLAKETQLKRDPGYQKLMESFKLTELDAKLHGSYLNLVALGVRAMFDVSKRPDFEIASRQWHLEFNTFKQNYGFLSATASMERRFVELMEFMEVTL